MLPNSRIAGNKCFAGLICFFSRALKNSLSESVVPSMTQFQIDGGGLAQSITKQPKTKMIEV